MSIPYTITPALGVTTADDAHRATEIIKLTLHCTHLEREIASFIEEYALKDLELHRANLGIATTSGHVPVRLTHNRGLLLEAPADHL
jgi:hypothetical protein